MRTTNSKQHQLSTSDISTSRSLPLFSDNDLSIIKEAQVPDKPCFNYKSNYPNKQITSSIPLF